MATKKQPEKQTTELALKSDVEQIEVIKAAVIDGNLAGLPSGQLIEYTRAVCVSLGLNFLTRPFQLINMNGKLVLYATKDCTEQLRSVRSISLKIISREIIEGCYVVTAQASDPIGRIDEATGAVAVQHLKGEALANAMMKAETKAKRRVTLSICGLGWTDESEVDSIPGAQRISLDAVTAASAPDQPVGKAVESALSSPENRAQTGSIVLRTGQYAGLALKNIPIQELAAWARKYESRLPDDERNAIAAWLILSISAGEPAPKPAVPEPAPEYPDAEYYPQEEDEPETFPTEDE